MPELKIIRVELHGKASEDDYENLHAYMQKNGWLRYIYPNAPGSKGGPFMLPMAMYCGDSSNECADTTEGLRVGINASVWANCTVLVMGVGVNWSMRWN